MNNVNKKIYYKYLFIVAALWNIVASITFLITSIFFLSMFPSMGIAIPPSMIWLHTTLFLVIVLGIGYLIVSKDISKNHGIVFIGIIAKLSFFTTSFIYFFLGDVGISNLLMGLLDIAFTILFIEFLLNFKKL